MPANAVLFVAVIAGLITLPALIEVNFGTEEAPIILPTAFYAVVSVAVIGLYSSFAIPIYPSLEARRRVRGRQLEQRHQVQVDEPGGSRRDRDHLDLLHPAALPVGMDHERRTSSGSSSTTPRSSRAAPSSWSRSGGICQPRSGSPARSTRSTRTWSRLSTTECLLLMPTWTASPCWRGGPGASPSCPVGSPTTTSGSPRPTTGHTSTSWSAAPRATRACSASTATTSTSTRRPQRRPVWRRLWSSTAPTCRCSPSASSKGGRSRAPTSPTRRCWPGRPTRSGACTRAHASSGSSTCSPARRRTARRSRSSGLRLPPDYDDLRRRVGAGTPGAGGAARADGALQQRPAGGQLHRRRREGAG